MCLKFLRVVFFFLTTLASSAHSFDVKKELLQKNVHRKERVASTLRVAFLKERVLTKERVETQELT